MKIAYNKIISLALAVGLILECFNLSVKADFFMENMNTEFSNSESSAIGETSKERAYNKITSWTIASGATMVSDTALSLATRDIVELIFTYSPTSASVDFGLISEGGIFYYTNVSNGYIDIKIEVPLQGKYYIAIRNNSSSTVKASGEVYY